MQVRRVGQKSTTYIGRKCKVCNLSAKGGEIIVTGWGWSGDFFHRPCMEETFEAFDEKVANSGKDDPIVKALTRKDMKARRVEEEFEILRLKLLKTQS